MSVNDLNNDQFLAEAGKAFYKDGWYLADEILGKEMSLRCLYYLSRKVYTETNSLLESFTNRCIKENRRVDCHEGCSWCCIQAVLILPYEAFYLMNYIEENLEAELKKKVHKQIRDKNRVTGRMKVQEFLHFKSPCPMLKEDACLIYPARPMACRIYLSSDVDSCQYEFHHPSETDYFPGLYEFPLHAGRMMNEGICAWLRENRIHPYECRMESALITVLDEDDCFNRWVSGENLFQVREYDADEVSYLRKFSNIK